MVRKLMLVGIIAVLVLAVAAPALATRTNPGSGRGGGPIIYVYGDEGEELFFDSIVVAEPVPNKGKFQKLEMGGPSGLQTEFGPGDQEYAGGRWWLDLNGNGVRDAEGTDHYFVCPLLGPGFETLP
jgi:hypothetical protein